MKQFILTFSIIFLLIVSSSCNSAKVYIYTRQASKSNKITINIINVETAKPVQDIQIKFHYHRQIGDRPKDIIFTRKTNFEGNFTWESAPEGEYLIWKGKSNSCIFNPRYVACISLPEAGTNFQLILSTISYHDENAIICHYINIPKPTIIIN